MSEGGTRPGHRIGAHRLISLPMPLLPPIGTALRIGLLASALVVGGCGVPPELQPKPGVPVPAASTSPTPAALPPSFNPTPSGLPSSPAPFPEAFATECLGRPSLDQVIAMVRRTSQILPTGAKVTAVTGPLCAGSWQYTVVQVPDREPLQVVSKGAPSALTMVTAGTDICTIEVRNSAPAGIRIAARC
jgi:hypothetical protein